MELKKACYSPEQQACSVDFNVLITCKLAIHLLGKQGHQCHRAIPKGENMLFISFFTVTVLNRYCFKMKKARVKPSLLFYFCLA